MQQKAPFIIVAIVILLAIVGGVVYATVTNEKPHDHNDGTHSHSDEEMNSGNDSEANVATETNTVAISNFEYSPAAITVKAGTKVTWTNNDSVEHNVVSDGSATLSSPLLAKGESWSYTFNEPGEYAYLCSPHPYMKGTVTVTE